MILTIFLISCTFRTITETKIWVVIFGTTTDGTFVSCTACTCYFWCTRHLSAEFCLCLLLFSKGRCLRIFTDSLTHWFIHSTYFEYLVYARQCVEFCLHLWTKWTPSACMYLYSKYRGEIFNIIFRYSKYSKNLNRSGGRLMCLGQGLLFQIE